MIENAPSFISDEAISSVDTGAEKTIYVIMGKLAEGRASFIIAHRLPTIKDSDIILLMKETLSRSEPMMNCLLRRDSIPNCIQTVRRRERMMSSLDAIENSIV